MKPYALVVTQRKQFVTISFQDADVAEADNRLVWTIDDMRLDSLVKAKLFKTIKEHFIGGNVAQYQGAMYHLPLEDMGHMVRACLGEDVRSRRVRLTDERYEAASAQHSIDDAVTDARSHDLWFGVGNGIGVLIKCTAWVVWAALRIAMWMVLFPILLSAFRSHGKKH